MARTPKGAASTLMPTEPVLPVVSSTSDWLMRSKKRITLGRGPLAVTLTEVSDSGFKNPPGGVTTSSGFWGGAATFTLVTMRTLVSSAA